MNKAAIAAAAASARQTAPRGLAALSVNLSETAERASRTEGAGDWLNAVAGVRASLLGEQ